MTTAFKRFKPLESDQETTKQRLRKRFTKYRSKGRLRVPLNIIRVNRVRAGRMGGYSRAKALTKRERQESARIAAKAMHMNRAARRSAPTSA